MDGDSIELTARLAAQRIADHMEDCSETRVEQRKAIDDIKAQMSNGFSKGHASRERLHARIDETNATVASGFSAMAAERSRDRLAVYGQIVVLLITILGYFLNQKFGG